jgi:membrane protein DedA with SNARE-associated domain
VEHVVDHYGLAFLFLIVFLESAGVWVPGETALVAAGVLASRGHFSIPAVIALAALGAILGDNVGYWIGRVYGRKLFVRFRRLEAVLPRAERFFRRHGGKAVFFARFIAGLRVTGAWMAGISHMEWWRFLFWNALGGIAWATGIGLIAFYLGRAAGDLVSEYGLIGGGAVLGLTVLIYLGVHFWRRRMEEGTDAPN